MRKSLERGLAVRRRREYRSPPPPVRSFSEHQGPLQMRFRGSRRPFIVSGIYTAALSVESRLPSRSTNCIRLSRHRPCRTQCRSLQPKEVPHHQLDRSRAQWRDLQSHLHTNLKPQAPQTKSNSHPDLARRTSPHPRSLPEAPGEMTHQQPAR